MKRFLFALLSVSMSCALVHGVPKTDIAHVHYKIDVSGHNEHRLHVSVRLDPGHEQRTFRLPTWYATYQIRNFSQYLRSPVAFASDGSRLSLLSVDKTTWAVTGNRKAARLEYDMLCELPGPYGIEAGPDRITINPALLLAYSPQGMIEPLNVQFERLPAGWQLASTLPGEGPNFSAANYEQIADSPFWIGRFSEKRYTEGNTTVRIIVDANPGDYNMDELVRRNHNLVHIERKWMGELPTEAYTFLYRFSDKAGESTEGMEHANGTFISVPAMATRQSMGAIDNVTAHEFFHLWNVMRIRPCSMEPVDFVHEQYSSTLWFSEGFTSAVSRLFLLQAGYLSEADFYDRLAATLNDLQRSPANSWQSAEDASISVWLSRSEAYDSPERSISYYRKGELLAFLIDLRIRKETNGEQSIRDLFRSMEILYGAPQHCFAESKAIQKAVEALTGRPESEFFEKYVAGHEDLPFNESLAFVGLTMDQTGVHPASNAPAQQVRQRQAWLQQGIAP
jgi:predicted metalloprotease with PDZ domain